MIIYKTTGHKTKFTKLALCTLIPSMVAIAGCSEPAKVSPAPSAAEPQKPFPLSMLIPLYSPEPPDPAGEALKMIEAYTNTKPTISWIPSVSYDDRFKRDAFIKRLTGCRCCPE